MNKKLIIFFALLFIFMALLFCSYIWISRFYVASPGGNIPQVEILHLKNRDVAIVHFLGHNPFTYSQLYIAEYPEYSDAENEKIVLKEYKQLYALFSKSIYGGDDIILQLRKRNNDIYYYSTFLCTLYVDNNRIQCITKDSSNTIVSRQNRTHSKAFHLPAQAEENLAKVE